MKTGLSFGNKLAVMLLLAGVGIIYGHLHTSQGYSVLQID